MKITCHWTAGTYTPSLLDKEHYHYIVGYKDNKPFIVKGRYAVEDNFNCSDGRYAAHCGGGNSNNIGIAVACMHAYKSPQQQGDYPMKQAQFEKMCRLIAEVAHKYNIPIDKDHVFTHYEFGKAHPTTSSAGKIDITFLPFEPTKKANEIGNYIRNKAQVYYNRLYGNI